MFPTAVARPACGKSKNRESSPSVRRSADGRESDKLLSTAGTPLLRVVRTNARRFARESRATGCALFPRRILRYRLDL